MSDKPEPTAEEKMADALPANTKYVVSGAPNARSVTLLPCAASISASQSGGSYSRARAAAPSGCTLALATGSMRQITHTQQRSTDG